MVNKCCKKCKAEKHIMEFYNCLTTRDKKRGECKKCTYKRVRQLREQQAEKWSAYCKEYRKINKERLAQADKEYHEKNKTNPEYIFKSRYRQMKSRVNGRSTHYSSAEGLELCSKQDFMRWCENNYEDFMKIYLLWEQSGYELKYSPSIDRINSQIGYIPTNMQWLTQSDNRKKENGSNTKIPHNRYRTR